MTTLLLVGSYVADVIELLLVVNTTGDPKLILVPDTVPTTAVPALEFPSSW